MENSTEPLSNEPLAKAKHPAEIAETQPGTTPETSSEIQPMDHGLSPEQKTHQRKLQRKKFLVWTIIILVILCCCVTLTATFFVARQFVPDINEYIETTFRQTPEVRTEEFLNKVKDGDTNGAKVLIKDKFFGNNSTDKSNRELVLDSLLSTRVSSYSIKRVEWYFADGKTLNRVDKPEANYAMITTEITKNTGSKEDYTISLQAKNGKAVGKEFSYPVREWEVVDISK